MADEQDSGSEYDFAPREQPTEPKDSEGKPEESAAEQPEGKIEERICPNCGFHVVGRTKRNRCPECSGDLSATAELLQFSDSTWLRSLATGLILMIPGVLLECGAMTLAWLNEDAKAGAWLYVAGAVAMLAGAWMATTKENRANAPVFHWASAMRGLAVTATVLALLLAVSPEQRWPGLSRFLVVLLLLALAGLGGATGLHIRALALRMPSDSLFWWSQNLSWLVPIVALGQIPLHFLSGELRKTFLSLFMCAVPMAGGYTVIALAACWTLLKGMLELRNSAEAAEGIVARRILKEKELAEVKKKRRG